MTDFNKCLEMNNISMVADNFTEGNSSFSNCADIKSYIEENGLSCDDATVLYLSVTPGTRDGMNILGIIVFTIAFGIVLGQLGPEGRRLVKVIGTLNQAIMRLVSIVMW